MLLSAPILLLLLPPSGDGARAPGAPAAEDYVWPVPSPRIVTSTFGEYRLMHFHAGLDISSGDVTGEPVFASRAGYVARIRIAASGYGRILYVRHPDGFTTTYAHLERFSPAIEARAAGEQQRLGRYPVDLTCDPGEFPVHQGETIALSGETGASSPHLHFEIRDPAGDPVNPFLSPGLRVRDTIPPSITAIALSPLGPESTVDGAPRPRVEHPGRLRRGSLVVARPLVITGDAGFSVEARDRIPGSRFREGVYARSLFIDGVTLYSERMDRTPWEEAHEIDLCYERSIPARGRFARLYIDSPNHLPFYAPAGSRAGIIDGSALRPGPHEFRIVCADFEGNSEEVRGTLIVSRVPSGKFTERGDTICFSPFTGGDLTKITLEAQTADGGSSRRVLFAPPGGFPPTLLIALPPGRRAVASVTLENRWGTSSGPSLIGTPSAGAPPPPLHISLEPADEYVRVRVNAEGVLASPPSVTILEGTRTGRVVLHALSPREFTGWFSPRTEFSGIRRITAEATSAAGRSSATGEIDIRPILPGTSGAIAYDGGNLLIGWESASVLKPLFLRIAARTDPDADSGTVYALEPAGAVLGTGLVVSIRTRRPYRGLYCRRGGTWQFIGGGGGAPTGGRITGRLGEVTLLADSTPPVLVRLRAIRRRAMGAEIMVRYSDDLSGVEYDDLKMYIDGIMVIPEIDGRRHRAVYATLETLGRGPHQLTMRLTDRMGNTGSTNRRFVLP